MTSVMSIPNEDLTHMRPERACNGTRMFVDSITRGTLTAEFADGELGKKHVKLTVPRITLLPSLQDYPYTLRRRQFPVRVAFAMAMDKSQGQTLNFAGSLCLHMATSSCSVRSWIAI